MKKDFSVQEEQENNELLFKEMLKKIKPDLYVLMDILEETGVNPLVVWKIIRQLNNIAIGNKYGQVTVEIQKGIVMFVRGEEADRVNEELIIKKDTP